MTAVHDAPVARPSAGFRLAQSSRWLWLYLPFLAFTIFHYLTSLPVNSFIRDFQRLGRSGVRRDGGRLRLCVQQLAGPRVVKGAWRGTRLGWHEERRAAR
jgi:hypothetical protein